MRDYKNQRERLSDVEKEMEFRNINIAEMEDKLEKMQQIEKENNKHKEKLVNLYELGMIDRDKEPK